jgi:hypothetical protein
VLNKVNSVSNIFSTRSQIPFPDAQKPSTNPHSITLPRMNIRSEENVDRCTFRTKQCGVMDNSNKIKHVYITHHILHKQTSKISMVAKE